MVHNFDDSPLRPAVDGTKVKSFQEFLDISLQEQDSLFLNDSSTAEAATANGEGDVPAPVPTSPIKRPFLKKGSGLARFKLAPNANVKRCQASSCSRNIANCQDKPHPKPWARRVQSCVQVLPKTQTRTNLSLTTGQAVTVSRLDVKDSKGQRGTCSVNHESRPSSCSKNSSHHVPPIPPSPASSTCSSSVENLERLLQSVRGRKEQVLQHLGELPVKSSLDTSDFDEEDDHERDSFDDDDDEQSWTDHSEDEDLFRARKASTNNSKSSKKVRWSKGNTKHSAVNRNGVKHLNKAVPGPYSLYLAECISTLESRLQALQDRCGKNLVNKTNDDSPNDRINNNNSNSKSNSNNNNNNNNHLSTGNSDTEFIRREMSELNKKINSLSENLQALQLLTTQITSKVGISKTTPDESSMRRRVVIQKGPENQDVVTTKILSPSSKGNNKGSKNKESLTVLESGDTVQKLPDGTIIHHFQNGTKQTCFIDGSKVIEFPSGQIERTMPNGVKHINYPNHSQRIINPDGSEEMTLADGTILRVTPDGTEVVILPNGEREIRSSQFTRREYKNGTVRTIYQDGTQETRYPNGRVRIKDKFNNVLVDSITS